MGLINDIGDSFDIDVRATSKELLKMVKDSEDDYELMEFFDDFIISLVQKAAKKYKSEIECKEEKIKNLQGVVDDLKTFNEYSNENNRF